MRDLKKEFMLFINTQNLFEKNDPILLAVSGGVDSVVMAHLFSAYHFSFAIGHVNFLLRGKESDEDENFVRSLAADLGVKFFKAQFDSRTHARINQVSVQMAARELRYTWLDKVRKENGYHRIATAHHADDSVETVLINMFRGTGISGLHGILPKNDKVIRPLLNFSKNDIEAYAESNKISFRNDESNFETDYDRNKIRLEIIPSIEKHFPSFKKIFSENILNWKDAAELFHDHIERIKKKVYDQKGDEVLISIGKLKTFPAYRTVLFELLKEFSFNSDQVAQIALALNSEPGKMFLTATHRVLKDRKNLIIAPITASSISSFLIHERDESVAIGDLRLKISKRPAKDFTIPKEPYYSCLNRKELKYPLVLRKWRTGDYFYPLGMRKKKKKISDYLIDRKIPLSEKENIRVIESGKRIACILGERIDERFKITPAAQQIVIFELQQK